MNCDIGAVTALVFVAVGALGVLVKKRERKAFDRGVEAARLAKRAAQNIVQAELDSSDLEIEEEAESARDTLGLHRASLLSGAPVDEAEHQAALRAIQRAEERARARTRGAVSREPRKRDP